jgi:hypothetical protein
MLLTLGALLAMTAASILISRRQRWSMDLAQLGCVSEQWLAEYRASHPS